MKLISVEEVKQALDEKQPAVLLDVRTTEEFLRGHINGSIHIPLDDVCDSVENFVADKNATIYVYCLSGSRSGVAATLLERCGYKNVYSMTSGLLAWRAKGNTLVTT